MVTLNLPPTPPELRSIAPYLQRATELKTQEPIIAYWCAYYAAQLGIGVKAKETTARNFLFELLGTLEQMKKEIGPNDAIDDENASSALVESFAFKVFNMADSEDRNGQATRGTAKKFLAAAHFLEILCTFESGGASDGVGESTNAEKIRYAKWKAADIAKAFREGRQPTPGPAGGLQDELTAEVGAGPSISVVPAPFTPPHRLESTSPSGIFRMTSPPPLNLPSTSPYPPPPRSPSATPLMDSSYLNPDALSSSADPNTPGNWSNIATPGTPRSVYDPDDVVADGNPTPTQTPTMRPWVSQDTEGRDSDSELEEDTLLGRQRAALSTSATINSSGAPTSVLTTESEGEPVEETVIEPSSVSTIDVLAAKAVPTGPVLPPPPSMPVVTQPVRRIPVIPHPVPAARNAEALVLTPSLVSKAQRHCKFAISALDYEDAETARKELRAALAILEG